MLLHMEELGSNLMISGKGPKLKLPLKSVGKIFPFTKFLSAQNMVVWVNHTVWGLAHWMSLVNDTLLPFPQEVTDTSVLRVPLC